jgi:hypothetical protein
MGFVDQLERLTQESLPAHGFTRHVGDVRGAYEQGHLILTRHALSVGYAIPERERPLEQASASP